MAIDKLNSKEFPRQDKEILNDILRTLLKENSIRSIDFHDISVDVENGQVCLSGHVAADQNSQRIEETTSGVPGVISIHNHLVTDCSLRNQVAQALGEDRTTRFSTLTLNIHHGWVELDGSVPNREIQLAAESTAASVPAVRGVIHVPGIAGEQSALARKAVQPLIGERVFGNEETQGRVCQVVITPQNRLVTHAIVREDCSTFGWQEPGDLLIPVQAMDKLDEGGIFLTTNDPAIPGITIFTPEDYPFAPFTWQPPYPYAVGSVRWPRPEKVYAKLSGTENALQTTMKSQISDCNIQNLEMRK